MKVTGYSKVLINILFLIASFFIGAIVIEFWEPLNRITMGVLLDLILPILIGLLSILAFIIIVQVVLSIIIGLGEE